MFSRGFLKKHSSPGSWNIWRFGDPKPWTFICYDCILGKGEFQPKVFPRDLWSFPSILSDSHLAKFISFLLLYFSQSKKVLQKRDDEMTYDEFQLEQWVSEHPSNLTTGLMVVSGDSSWGLDWLSSSISCAITWCGVWMLQLRVKKCRM